MQQKTVFISYRHSLSKHLARSIYQDLKMHDWDVFLDVNAIDSGDFDRIILNQIAARAHFILLISHGSLERCTNSGDWVLREIQEAVRLKRNIVPIVEDDADFAREISYLPDDLRAIVGKKNFLPLPHFFFDAAVEMLRTRFLKTPEYIDIKPAPLHELREVKRRIQEFEKMMDKPSSQDMLPSPFEWIEIPNGSGTMKTNNPDTVLTIPKERYWIAKYPITNAQYKFFVNAGGYNERKWWTDKGWEARKEGWQVDDINILAALFNKDWKIDDSWKPSVKAWTEPRFWQDSKWNNAEQPVVGVSWYEAVAFCLWLSEVTGEHITLPTEAQWQYAAQGDDARIYPWGNEWDCERCNNSIKPCNSDGTTKVTAYENKGDSYFGVVDMVGNVADWCLTNYDNDDNNIYNHASRRVLRGGSWFNVNVVSFSCVFRGRVPPHYWDYLWGFRIVRNDSP